MSITRFKEAQERFGEYETALEEIRQGRKRSHWIWYIFPQPKGLGRSYNSEYYGIASLEEAKEYLGDAVLRGRLLEISKALIEHKEEDIHSIMGGIDAQKLRSSMTNSIFRAELENLYIKKDIAYKDATEAAREVMREIIAQIDAIKVPPQSLQEKMLELAIELRTVTGRKQYGYLKQPLKEKVDCIVD